MRPIFADTAYYVGLLMEDDDLHASAMEVSRRVESREAVTIDVVLMELLAFVSNRGAGARRAALSFVDELRSNRNVSIVRQTPELFDAGIELYRERPDKGYSLTDCMSMLVCRQLDIRDVLTHDRHREQEGFSVLL